MKKKIGMLILWIVLSALMGAGIVFSEKYSFPLGAVIAGALIAIFIEKVWKAGEDLFDTTNWMVSQTKLKRGGLINDDTIIRISFSYLYRMKIGDKYFLVLNKRTRKYQPVGGVYKFQESEKLELKNSFHVADDNKIQIDNSSRDDYRLRLQNKFLRDFIKRFDSTDAVRERIDNVGREFKEELIETGILNWEKISYRYCGRHITDLRFSEHFQIYEVLLYDVVELIPAPDQEQDLKHLIQTENEKYRFASADQVTCLGMNTDVGELFEWIGDHTKCTLEENEAKLMKMPGVGKIYEANLK